MASYSNFQGDDRKYTSGKCDDEKISTNYDKTVENLRKDKKFREQIKKWTSFFRANPHRLVEYWGIVLNTGQKILLYMCFHVDFFLFVASRGLGKSWLVGLLCCVYCVLYPGTRICLASGTKGQAKLIISEKIQEFYDKYPILRKEIKEIKTSNNDIRVVFRNGSTIVAVTSSDNSRGHRGNILVIDESRLVKKEILDTVLKPFLNVNRQPPYLRNPKYKHLQEENKEIYITSAYYKNSELYQQFKAYTEQMIKGKDYFVCGLPYTYSMAHGLLSRKRVDLMKTERDFDSVSFLMEYENLFYGQNNNAFFKLDDLQDARTLYKPFYPINNLEYLSNKKVKKPLTKKINEIRVIGVDVALMGGRSNDNTIFTCLRLLPNGDSFEKQLVHIGCMNGEHSETQAINLHRLYDDFDADYVVMDCMGNGISLYDACCKVLYDTERDIEYEAWTSFNDSEMRSRALSDSALPIIYSMKVNQPKVNHEMASWLRDDFSRKKIKLLINDIEGREFLNNKEKFKKMSEEDKVYFYEPYVQTTLLVNELVNLSYEVRSGFIKVVESRSNRKDRYSSLAYANYYLRILENDLLRIEDNDEDVSNFLLID